MQKHPHARGEDGAFSYLVAYARETPPRTWGRLVGGSIRHITGRNTPTHVGKTIPAFQRMSDNGKHPHARGEDPVLR